MPMNASDIQKKLEWRYATKVFNKEKKINAQDWNVLENSLVLAPSSYGLQPWKFVIVENPEVRTKLRAASWGQAQVTDASHYVVFTTLKNITEDYIKEYISSIAQVRGQTVESLVGFQDMMIKSIVKGKDQDSIKVWNQRQAYIAMGFLLETAALLDIDTVPLEGLDPKVYDTILGLDQTDYGTVAAVALGYRDETDKYAQAKKVRFSKDKMIQKI